MSLARASSRSRLRNGSPTVSWICARIPVAIFYREFARAIAGSRLAVPDFTTAVPFHQLLGQNQRTSDTGSLEAAGDQSPRRRSVIERLYRDIAAGTLRFTPAAGRSPS
jgi:hypothetical protein